ncbi:MAG: hypothetical protein P8178_15595 [Candidatus Thiodiazotropha sp.]
MGNFYVNYIAQSSDTAKVARALAGRRAFVTSVPEQPVVVFDQTADSQDQREIKELGRHLSAAIGRPVLAILNHDDDILWYCLFVDGQCEDEYDSCPDYFKAAGKPRGPTGGQAAKLCQEFGTTNAEKVEEILRSNDYVFACDRHEDLLNALGLPGFGVAVSFGDISQGELPPGLSRDNLIEIT